MSVCVLGLPALVQFLGDSKSETELTESLFNYLKDRSSMKCAGLLLTVTSFALAVPPPHPAVVRVREEELSLPNHLRKPALNNPHLWKVLPLTSMLHHGEMPVFDREAEKVPRGEIYNVLTHAGFIPRRRLEEQHPGPIPWHQERPPQQNNDYFGSSDHLQYL